ncbi:GNAT family N-acetyltransferase [Lysinibacter cavernae]|uniref:RimJ/RimL family protein N-acetyltransferase n=1 Tax=Lysinibacter cavernae TaxID=1640652 RepID=A0A7X5R0G3_9MICO|nr:GNAT family protein [Lysinibacter cavernae]NIH53341.1 RimJ/RimL family protein N-acetyltransferase [Lysinibacter cavernae]
MAFADPVTLTGERVTLVPLSHEHHDDLALATDEGKLWEAAWYTTVPSPEGMSAEIDRRLGLQQLGTMLPWATINNETGRAIGMTTLMNIREDHRHVEIGSTWMAKSAQRTGINPEAKLLQFTHSFDTLNAVAVEIRTHWHNHQSREAIARLGAKQDGVLRNHDIWKEGIPRDVVVFSVIESEWPVVRMSLNARLRRYASPSA